MPLTGERRLETLFQAPGVERNPAIAPSGRFIAYNSDESGRPRCTCGRSRMPAPESGQSPPMAAQVRCGRAVGARLSTRTAKAASWRLRCEATERGRFLKARATVQSRSRLITLAWTGTGMSLRTASVSCLSE